MLQGVDHRTRLETVGDFISGYFEPTRARLAPTGHRSSRAPRSRGAAHRQPVRCPQTEMRTQPRGLQIDRIGHRQKRELVELLAIGSLQHGVASLRRPDQAFAFDQRRDTEARVLGCGNGAGYEFARARVVFD
jgi:hypothetical protein